MVIETMARWKKDQGDVEDGVVLEAISDVAAVRTAGSKVTGSNIKVSAFDECISETEKRHGSGKHASLDDFSDLMRGSWRSNWREIHGSQ